MAKKKEVYSREEILWEYLKRKLCGIKDNNLTAKQVYQYVTKHFKPNKNGI